MKWDTIVKRINPYVVKIETPNGSGTGFLCLYNADKTICGVATALHVVNYADDWKQPIRITHHDTLNTVFLEDKDRVILSNWGTDSAIILFNENSSPFPKTMIPLLPLDNPLGIGFEVGWLGFPAIDPQTLCFFSGVTSAWQQNRKAYLIDGVAIHGVSGGPVFYSTDSDGVQIIGIVSQYHANRVTGETLPGLLIAQDVSHFHEVIIQIKTFDEANKLKEKQINQQLDTNSFTEE